MIQPEQGKDYHLIPMADGIASEQARCMSVMDNRYIFVAMGKQRGPGPSIRISTTGGEFGMSIGVRVLERRPEGLWREEVKCYYRIESGDVMAALKS